MKAHEQIRSLLEHISQGLYEKEQIIAMALLSAVAGESIFLLGPPGTAKSLVARRLESVFDGTVTFEYLMSRFSTPDEIFGPISISQMKNHDIYERNTEGYLPSATIVFLDEIWKAGPSIQNALLTAINEKLYHNGNKVVALPMKLLIAASNELPAKGEGLEALWDRFLVRMVSNPIGDESAFIDMISGNVASHVQLPAQLRIKDDDYHLWQEQMTAVTMPSDISSMMLHLRQSMQRMMIDEDSDNDTVSTEYYISDRRWKKCYRLMQAAAFLNGRDAINVADFVLQRHCLWNDTTTIEPVTSLMCKAITHDIDDHIKELSTQLEKMQASSRNYGNASARKSYVPSSLYGYQVVDHLFFVLEDFPDGTCYFAKDDLGIIGSLKSPSNGVISYDALHKTYVVHALNTFAPVDFHKPPFEYIADIKLSRCPDGVAINKNKYTFARVNAQVVSPSRPTQDDRVAELDKLAARARELELYCSQLVERYTSALNSGNNPFVSVDDATVFTDAIKKCDVEVKKLQLRIDNMLLKKN